MRQLLFIPCKPFAQAKSRLAKVLSPAQREALARALYRHTLEIARACHGIEALIISSDPQALAMARSAGLGAITETGPQGLNAALETAMARFARSDEMAFAYLPTDLPALRVNDLATLADADRDFLIAPDARRQGTNLLRWPSTCDVRMAFGDGSFAVHCREARRLGLPLRELDGEGLRHDIDAAEDLDWLRRQPSSALGTFISILDT